MHMFLSATLTHNVERIDYDRCKKEINKNIFNKQIKKIIDALHDRG